MTQRRGRAASNGQEKEPAQHPLDRALVGGSHGSGSVTAGTQPPSGHYWDKLASAKRKGKDDLGELLDELEQHGYTRDGQIYTATLAAYNEAGGVKKSRRASREG